MNAISGLPRFKESGAFDRHHCLKLTARRALPSDATSVLDKYVLRRLKIRVRQSHVGCRIVLTDSGGLQEESTFLHVPCLTLRDNTERPATIVYGTNTLVGRQPADLARTTFETLAAS